MITDNLTTLDRQAATARDGLRETASLQVRALPAAPAALARPHLLARASDKERDRANLKHAIFTAIHLEVATTGKKNIVMSRCRQQAAALHRRGFSAFRLYNDYYKWLRSGRTAAALVPAAAEKRGMPIEAVAFIHGWMQRNQRSGKQGWRDFLERHWRAGEPVPGYGTWRDWYLKRWPDRALPRVCPPDIPTGWGYENLIRKHDDVETALARRGVAAGLSLLPSIPGTRAGMRPLEWITFDDVKLDFRVHVESVGRPVDVVALVAFDIATATVLGFGIRPVLLREDGTGEKLKRRDSKALLVQLLQTWGWGEYGMHIIQELGTAHVDVAWKAALAEATGGLVEVHDASMLAGTVWAGGFADRAVGNSRAKSWIESTFNPLHNRLGAIEGQTGRRYDVAPQDDAGRRKELKALVAAGESLQPELRAQLRLPYRSLADVRTLLVEAIRGLNSRTDHALKDFDSMLVWRFREGDVWMSEAELLDFEPAQLTHILTDTVPESPARRYDRLMSIERRAGARFLRLHPDSVPRLLQDQRWITKDGGEVVFQVEKKTCLYSPYTAANREALDAMEAGREYLAYYDASSGQVPPRVLYVTTGDGRWIGTLEHTAGIRRGDAAAASEAIAAKKRMLKDAIARVNANSPQVAEENEARIAHNLDVLARAGAMEVVAPCLDTACQDAPEGHAAIAARQAAAASDAELRRAQVRAAGAGDLADLLTPLPHDAADRPAGLEPGGAASDPAADEDSDLSALL